MMEPLLVLNVGWMKKYKGLKCDQITNGGKFPEEDGVAGEILNFLPFEGFMYGCVQPPGRNPYSSRTIHIERLRASTSRKDSSVEDVLVAWVARKPGGGTYLVGWYRNAIVFREWQKLPEGSNREFEGRPIGYYVKAEEKDCILLALEKRTLRVPRVRDSENLGKGGIGQANLWFADSGKQNDLKFRQDLKSFIQTYHLR